MSNSDESVLKGVVGRALEGKRLNRIDGCCILTDKLAYRQIDQVFPLFAEQQFFLDELEADAIQGADVLEVGLGSGVLSIGAIRRGARHVTALEINPRAAAFAGFNIVLNGAEGRISILQGERQVFAPVRGKQFDYIISNPPFEPTPQGMSYFYHSAAGEYGLDFLEEMFRGLDEHLAPGGRAQIVTASPGDAHAPTLLIDVAQRHLSGSIRLVTNPSAMTFDEVMDRLDGKQMGPSAGVEELRRKAARERVTHVHLCIIHYARGAKSFSAERSRKVYENFWDAAVPGEEYEVTGIS